MKLQGRRRPDMFSGPLPDDIQPGDYWKSLAPDGVTPETSDAPGNLTHGVWWVVAPIGEEGGYAIARLTNHTVREEEDGTISVRPGDGSSNSILISKGNAAAGQSFHGYIEHGVWSDV